jgi:L-asparaginase
MDTKKKVCILYTGGTIGMIPSEQGYVPAEGKLKMVLDGVQAMHHPDLPEWDLVEFSPLLDSSDIALKEWNEIGRTIARLYRQYSGFVVLHGTDTMAYSASALSYMLEGLNKPVVYTGSQIPLCQLRSDGRDNLITAMAIAASGRIHEVCLYFHGALLRGNRSTKLSSDRFTAFESPNAPHLADVGIVIQYNDAAILPPHIISSASGQANE